MESAALTRAQEHVRNASAATYAGDLARAGQEHELAAAAFHEGLTSTRNKEVRTRLLLTTQPAFSPVDSLSASSLFSRTTTAPTPAA